MTPTGIRTRHSKTCPCYAGGTRCSCQPSYEGRVYSAREGKEIRRTFPTMAAARSWRADALSGVRRGTLRSTAPTTVRQAADALLDGMRGGLVRTRSGEIYKPSAIRSYDAALRIRVLPELGAVRLADVQRRDVQRIADAMLADGCNPSTIRNAVIPVRVLFRRALEDGDVVINPCSSLRLPAVRSRRQRIVHPDRVRTLLLALKPADRSLYATAFYAGLRAGELRALLWADVDLAAGVIRVERALDDRGSVIEPKSQAGRRSIPIVAALRDQLVEQRMTCVWQEGLVFGGGPGQPFTPSSLRKRVRTAWRKASAKRVEELEELDHDTAAATRAAEEEFEPVGLHEARHTFASTLIDAGVNAKAIQTYMGHSSIDTTFDLYGHLMPGSESEAIALVDGYLARANTQARIAAIE